MVRFLRRHVRYLPADSGAGTSYSILRCARDEHGGEVGGFGVYLCGDAPRQAYRGLHLRPFRRRDRQEAYNDPICKRIRRGDAAHNPLTGLPAVGRSGSDPPYRFTPYRRDIPGRGVYLCEPASDGVLAEREAWILQRTHHERLPTGLRHHLCDHDCTATLNTGRRHKLALCAVGLEDTLPHRISPSLRPRLLL